LPVPNRSPHGNDPVFEIQVVEVQTRRLPDPHARAGEQSEQDAVRPGCCLNDLFELLLREVPLSRTRGLAEIEFPRHPDFAAQHQFDDADDIEDCLAA
jgi:hypothetical protein